MIDIIKNLAQQEIIKKASYQFAQLIDAEQKIYHYPAEIQNLAVFLSALLCDNSLNGSSCLDLNKVKTSMVNPHKNAFNLPLESLEQIRALLPQSYDYPQLLSSHCAFADEGEERITPMKFVDNLLFLKRYLRAEQRIGEYLLRQAQRPPLMSYADAKRASQIFFHPTDEKDYQQQAVISALQNHCTFISGGPGTGKTTTVIKILAALISAYQDTNVPLAITLAAPTGKASARLKEAVSHGITHLKLPQSIAEQIPREASTIHALLKIGRFSEAAKFNSSRPLSLDILVVDEISMIDVFLMEKLLTALSPHTRLIMLGDKDQLASVESGNIIAQLSEIIDDTSPKFASLRALLCQLHKSHRFKEDSGIKILSEQVNQQNCEILPIFDRFSDDIRLIDHHDSNIIAIAQQIYAPYFQAIRERKSIKEIFAAFHSARMLTVFNKSTKGSQAINELICNYFRKKHLLSYRSLGEAFIGKAVLIGENDYNLNIFNGDVGIMLADEQGKVRVYFEHAEGISSLIPALLPQHELAFAMTVHKSQGSEFATTALILPEQNSPLLTKELIYTAITRAKERFILLGESKILSAAIAEKTDRSSGLITLINRLISKEENYE